MNIIQCRINLKIARFQRKYKKRRIKYIVYRFYISVCFHKLLS